LIPLPTGCVEAVIHNELRITRWPDDTNLDTNDLQKSSVPIKCTHQRDFKKASVPAQRVILLQQLVQSLVEKAPYPIDRAIIEQL
jgi:hypothetical protein